MPSVRYGAKVTLWRLRVSTNMQHSNALPAPAQFAAEPEWSSGRPAQSVRKANRWQSSLRIRIAAGVALLSAVIALLVGVLALQLVASNAYSQLRQQALEQLSASVAGRTFGVKSTPNIDGLDMPRQLEATLATANLATYSDGKYMWAASNLSTGGAMSVRISERPTVHNLENLRNSLLFLLIPVVVLGGVSGFVLANSMTKQLRSATSQLANQRGDYVDSSVKIATPGNDEVAVLTREVDRLADTLRQRVVFERDFAQDLAHELRTPLTALVTNASLLPDGPDSDRVRAGVARLRGMVADILELARLERSHEHVKMDPVQLSTAIDTVLQPDADVNVVVRKDAQVRLNKTHFARAMRNAVTNAKVHGAAPVQVLVDGPRVTISDCGHGFPEQLLRRGPRRFTSYGGGNGLGLMIMIADIKAMDGVVKLSNSTTGALVSFIWEQ